MVLAAVEQYEPTARRLVNDDLAGQFLPFGQRWSVRTMRWSALRRPLIGLIERSGPGLWANLTCRKRYIDDKLDDALADIDAVVILGAGLDTRGYRLARRSNVPVFEVDLPINIKRKTAMVRRALGGAPRGGAPRSVRLVPRSVRLVPVDFERDNLAAALTANGYRGEHRTFFIWEGVTQYLTAEAVRATFEFLKSAAPSSRLAFTYVRKDFIDGVNLYGAYSLYRRFRQRRQIWHFGMLPEEMDAFVAQYGWRIIEQAGPMYLLHHYIRPTGRDLTASEIEWSAYAEKL
jgi:methyltransferase (TIGR00027 family)